MESTTNFDIVGSLPPEVAVLILRNLDGEWLSAASRVSCRWRQLCMGDVVLRSRLSRWREMCKQWELLCEKKHRLQVENRRLRTELRRVRQANMRLVDTRSKSTQQAI